MLPASPVKLGLAIWILIPQNEGERVVYLILSGYFKQFEEKVTLYRNLFFEFFFKGTLLLTKVTAEYCLVRVRSQKLEEFRKISKKIDLDMKTQMKVRGVVETQAKVTVAEGAVESSPSPKPEKRSYAQEMAVKRKRISTAKEKTIKDESDNSVPPSAASNIESDKVDPQILDRGSARNVNNKSVISGLKSTKTDDTDEHTGKKMLNSEPLDALKQPHKGLVLSRTKTDSAQNPLKDYKASSIGSLST